MFEHFRYTNKDTEQDATAEVILDDTFKILLAVLCISGAQCSEVVYTYQICNQILLTISDQMVRK